LEGRALSTTGAVSIYGSLAYILPGGGTILPIGLISFTGVCDNQNILLNWRSATETNNNYYTVERSAEQKTWLVIGTVQGAGNSMLAHSYTYTDRLPIESNSFYRLKQTDFDGNTNYGNIIQVKNCGEDDSHNLTLYPNPSSNGKFELLYTGDKSQFSSIEIFNALGEKVYGSSNLQTAFDLSDKSSGVYFVQVHSSSKTINLKVLVKE
jgi:Secretion system C-terminal sorting domain